MSETNELILVTQLPVIEEQLKQIQAKIEDSVSAALAMECTEDTYKDIKAIRAELNRDYKALEDKRIAVKKQILAPYMQFEEVYKACVSDIFKPADQQLAEKIAAVEDGLKAQKKSEIVAYFNEYTVSQNINFISFEDLDLSVTMATSKKGLKEKVKSFLDRIAMDLQMIHTQAYAAEILVEYKQTLNASQAIMTVTQRMNAVEEERQRAEAARSAQERKAEAVRQIDEIVEEQQELTVPNEEPIAMPLVQPERVVKAKFEVYGTVEQLKELKRYLDENLAVKWKTI